MHETRARELSDVMCIEVALLVSEGNGGWFGVETAREVGLGLSIKRKSVSQHQVRISLLLRNQTATLLNLYNRPFSPVGPSQIHNTNKPPTTSTSLLMNIHYYETNDKTQKACMPKIGDRMPTCIRAP